MPRSVTVYIRVCVCVQFPCADFVWLSACVSYPDGKLLFISVAGQWFQNEADCVRQEGDARLLQRFGSPSEANR